MEKISVQVSRLGVTAEITPCDSGSDVLKDM